MQKLVFKNGNGVEIDLTDFEKYGVTEWSGLSDTTLNIQTQQVPFNDGSVFLDALLNDRTISVKIAINDGGDLATRYELKRELIALLNPKLGEGVLTYTNDYLSKQITVIPNQPIFANKNVDTQGTLKADISFTACNPYWEDTEETKIQVTRGYFNIENQGDTAVPLKLNLLFNEVENLNIKNFTTDKAIRFAETLNKGIKIDTTEGKKTVVQQELGWQANYNTLSLKSIATNGEYFVIGAECGILLKTNNFIDFTTYVEDKDEDIISVVYSSELDLFIAISSKQHIYTSSDGETWTRSIQSPFYSFRNIYCNSNLCIIACNSGVIYTSPDGQSWTLITVSSNDNFNSITDNGSIYVMVGNSGVIYTSPDGESWVSQTSGVTSNLNSVVYGNGKFIAVGASGTVLSSTDGETWTQETYPSTRNINNVVYNSNLNLFMTYNCKSSDGSNWIEFNSDYSSYSLTYSSYLGTVLGVGNNFRIITCSDGAAWETQFYRNYLYASCVTYNNDDDYYIALGGNKVLISTDGKTWESSSILVNGSVTNINSLDVIYSSELKLFISVGYSGNIYTSSDGINWTKQVTGITSTIGSIVYNKTQGMFYAVSSNGDILTSTDGMSWDSQSISADLYQIVYIQENESLICVGMKYFEDEDTFYPVVFKSTDGMSWENMNIVLGSAPHESFPFMFTSIAYDPYNGVYIATGNIREREQQTWRSTDLINWVWAKASDGAGTYIAYSKGLRKFILITVKGFIHTQNYGENWTNVNVPINDAALTQIYINEENNLIIIVGNSFISSYFYESNNLISKISDDTDMSLQLEVGSNRLLISGEGYLSGTLSYRNRYIGV